MVARWHVCSNCVTGSKDGCVRVWNINYGLPINVFDMHVSVCRLLLTSDASHMVVQLEHSYRVPLMCLHNSPAAEVKSHSQIDIHVPRGTARSLCSTMHSVVVLCSSMQPSADIVRCYKIEECCIRGSLDDGTELN